MKKMIVRLAVAAGCAGLLSSGALLDARSADAAEATVQTPAKAASKAASKSAAKPAGTSAPKKADKSATPQSEKAKAKAAADEARARAELETAARGLVQKAGRTLRPDIAHKQVSKSATGYVASYLVVDETNVTFDMTTADLPGSKYVGNVAYVVHEYQCVGASESEARTAPCSRVKSRRMREYTRYEKGKWML